jgi:hypothetical protein
MMQDEKSISFGICSFADNNIQRFFPKNEIEIDYYDFHLSLVQISKGKELNRPKKLLQISMYVKFIASDN